VESSRRILRARRQFFGGKPRLSWESVEQRHNRFQSQLSGFATRCHFIYHCDFFKIDTLHYRSAGQNDHITYSVLGAFIDSFIIKATNMYMFVCALLRAHCRYISVFLTGPFES
jgi:hypothetical protein